MFSRFSFKSIASNSASSKNLAETLSESWSYKSYYLSVINKISEAIKKNEVSFELKINSNDEDLIKSLCKDLTNDGFRATITNLDESKHVILITGWTFKLEDYVQIEVKVKRRLSEWFLHTDIWDEAIEENKNCLSWIIGEEVADNKLDGQGKIAFLNRNRMDASILLSGQSGSGKTEMLKFSLMSFLKMNCSSRLYIADLKRTSDYNVFRHFTANGTIAKTEEEALDTIKEVFLEMEKRSAFYQKSEKKPMEDLISGDLSPIILVLEEFSVLDRRVKYQFKSREEGSIANALLQLISNGRHFGITIIFVTQSCQSDTFPLDIFKNIKNTLAFRSGTRGESLMFLNTEDAFNLGKIAPDDIHNNRQSGYFYDGSRLIRSLKVDDYFIYHELVQAFNKFGRLISFDLKSKIYDRPYEKSDKNLTKSKKVEHALLKEFIEQYTKSLG